MAEHPPQHEPAHATVLATWNDTGREFPAGLAVEWIARRAASQPDAEAVRCGAQALSYRDLNRRANRLARRLIDLGAAPGKPIAVYARRSPELVIALLAVQKSGACYLPIDPDYPAERIRHVLQDSQALAVLGDRASLARQTFGTLTIALDHGDLARADADDDPDPPARARPEDPIYLIYTSGSTGTPKGALVHHGGAVNQYQAYVEALSISSASSFLIFSSIGFDLTQRNLWAPLMAGGRVVLFDSGVYDAEGIVDTIARERITHINCTPSAFYGLIDEATPRTFERLACLSHVALGGEAIQMARLKAWRANPRFAADIVNCYGPTECAANVAMYKLPKNVVAGASGGLPIGRPIANVQLHVVDEQLKPVAIGEEGELCIAGAGVGLGYLRRPEKTAEVFVANPFGAGKLYRSGDRARWLADGNLEYLGRIDQQVKVRGVRIELGEIESALLRHAAVREAAAGVIDDRLCAWVALRAGHEADLPGLRANLAQRLPEAMIPSRWSFVERLPVNAHGKLDRKALPAPSRARPPLAVSYAPPQGPLEAQIAERWRALLDLDEIGRDDAFFELGGSSLTAIQFVGRLSRALDETLPVVGFFAAPTLRRYAEHLARHHAPAVQRVFGIAAAKTTAAAGRPRPTSHVSRLASHDSIAIVGMAARLPGAADVDQFWSNLRSGVESIRPLTDEELDGAGVPTEQRNDPNYVRMTATLDHADCFDAAFFGYSPREAALMDPQQRILLECSWAALEHAGYDPSATPGRVGVFAGVSRNSYFQHNLAGNPSTAAQLGEINITYVNDKDYAASRVAYKLDLKGPAITSQTACSTGGVVLHQARRALLAGDCDVALVGGARVVCPLGAGYLWVDGSILTRDGHMRVFDAEGSGMIRGSGVAVLALKRVSDAERDGDTIYALVKGSALNNDGADKISYTAPSVPGQAEVIRLALDDAGVSADSISYIEAHGTATHLGDPIEIAGLTQAYREDTQRTGYCRIGSVKSNIGHLDPVGAIASTIKTALAMRNREIPPSVGYSSPNPQIDFAHSPFVVAASLTPWDSEGPRRAGVSSFGIGGTNAHLILEEAPEIAPSPAPQRALQVLPLSAKTEGSLSDVAAKLAEHFRSPGATRVAPGLRDADLADAAYTLQSGRARFDRRAVVVARDVDSAAHALGAKESWARGTPLPAPRIVFVFPGQGSQHPGMGRDLYDSEPVYRAIIDEGSERLHPLLGLDLRTVLYPPSAQAEQAAAQLRQTTLAQPAIFLVSYALARLWESLGIRPDVMVGHSVGEFVAATLGGVFGFADALKLLAARARLMQSMPAGSMLAVRLPEAEVRALLPADIDIAALNAPSSTIVSGPTPSIDALDAGLQARGIGSARLHTSHAFHSAMMEPVLDAFAVEVASVPRKPLLAPIISTATGEALTEEQAHDPRYWARQLRKAVRFAPAIETALKSAPCGSGTILLEVGPGQSFAGPLRQLAAALAAGKAAVVPSAPPAAQEDASAAEAFFDAFGRLWVHGVDVDWLALHGGAPRRRVGLPTYAFARTRHWIEPTLAPRAAATDAQLDQAADAATAALPPADALRARAVKTLADITGLTFAPDDDDKSFLERGMDSLMLTQVAGRLKAEFKLDLRFRQLMEELSTLAKLVEHLRAHAVPLAPTSPNPDGNAAPASDTNAPEATAADAPKKVFGAAVRIQKTADGQLSARQRQSLDALIARYTARTAKSKASAQEHRAYFADPRTVSGFRPLWKELVYPIVSTRSDGARIWDVDGNEYIDTINGFGATFFGHRPPFVNEAVAKQLEAGYEIGPVQDFLGEAAKLFCEIARQERVGFCNTGSEAVTAAVRCARTVTGRDLVVSFVNDYHGIHDEVIVRPGPKGRGLPAASGIPANATAATLILNYDDPASLDIIAARGAEIAAVMVEPVQSRDMDLQPREFLHALRKLADEQGFAFIMDEVISGFRAAPGGAQQYFGVQADIATYGKVFGGGMPVGAVAGRAKFLDALDGGSWQFGDDSVPEAGVTYFAGTFVRHPLTMAAVLAVLRHLKANPDVQAQTTARVAAFVERLRTLAAELQAPLRFPHFSSLFRLEFTQDEPFGELFSVYLRERGLHTYDHRVQVMTTVHDNAVLDRVHAIVRDSIIAMQRDGLLGRVGEPVKLGFDAQAAGGIFYRPPLPDARLGYDAQGGPAWFIPDPQRAGQYLQVSERN